MTEDFGYSFQGSRFRVQGSGFRLQGAGCRVRGLGFSHKLVHWMGFVGEAVPSTRWVCG
jgi:hypothetical protein